jgi:hypothetical protein
MNIQELMFEWLVIMSTRIKESTATNYRIKVEKHIISYLGNINVCKVDSYTAYVYEYRQFQDTQQFDVQSNSAHHLSFYTDI